MDKEYHITYSIDNLTNGAKAAGFKVQRQMTAGGAEFVSKDDDYDGFIDIVFHYYGKYPKLADLTTQTIGSFKNSETRLSVIVYQHTPQVLVDIQDVKEPESFNQFIQELSKKNNAVSVEKDGKEENMLCVIFNKTADRISFQNEYSSKAENFMKNGQNSVVMHPTWEDVTLMQKNNSEENKRNSKYGY